MPDDDESTEQSTVAGENDATTIVPPPTQAAPELAWSAADDESESTPRPWRSVWAVAGVGVLCAVVTAVAIAAFGMGGTTKGTAPRALAPSAPPPSLDGTYRITSYPARAIFHGDAPPAAPDNTPVTSWWGFRSACFVDGCVALGTQLEDADHQRADGDHHQLTLDFIDGAWHQAVPRTYEVPCDDPSRSETGATSLVLAPRPDGTLEGTLTNTVTTNDCGHVGNEVQLPATATREGAAPEIAASPTTRPAVAPPPLVPAKPLQTVTERDEQFLATLADHGVPVGSFQDGARRAVSDGSGICDALAQLTSRWPAGDVIRQMQKQPLVGAESLTGEQVSWFVRLSVSTYCPQYEQ